MSLRLLIRDHPVRTFAIATGKHGLVFRHAVSSGNQDSTNTYPSSKPVSRCMVEFSDQADLSNYRVLRSSGIHGTLGLINIGNDLFLCVISGAVRVATVRPNETVQRIISVDFYCMNSAEYDLEYSPEFDPYSPDAHDFNAHHHSTYADESGTLEHPCLELKRILSSGTFYYSVDFDLTNRLQDRIAEDSAFEIDILDQDYLWNQYMIDPLIKFRARLVEHDRQVLDASRILTSAIRGFVLTITVPPSSSPFKIGKTNLPSTLTLISRLSCRRAGTRFNARGIDDDGNVANFVETETVYWHPSGLCFSYAQVRGSVPLFWEQASGLLPGQQKIQTTRSPEATQPAFDKHFRALELNYGTINVLNLLSDSRPGEAELTARYKYHIQHSPMNQATNADPQSIHRLLDIQFDFHAETREGGYEAASIVRRLVQGEIEVFGYFLCDEASPDEKSIESKISIISQQEGVFRTNCLDCLDRTNLIQNILSQMAMEMFFQHRRDKATPDFWARHSSLWADNGDALSKIYAGTGALKSSFTRHGKMSLAGALADARKSATRLYMNNFMDKGRQNTIDMLLGRLMEQSPVYLYDPITDYVNAELKRRFNEYSTHDTIRILVGTFNLNGKAGGIQHDLTPWLNPRTSRPFQEPEIVVVGFQELVELSPQQIMSTDPVRRQAWEQAVRHTLNHEANTPPKEEYVLLRSGQLVGAALMIFVKTKVLKSIKNVEGSAKKTGMSGIAGNKGAVAIRMDYGNTGLCFVTAHLAAGFANYEERNRDYQTISQGLHFQRNRSIEDHEAIIWAGDFNYRIGLSDEKVRRFAKAGDLDNLYQNDQLNLQMVAGRTFPFYAESRITFLPTYKYDNGSDDYDTSEKARIPAWCDRVLRKGDILKQIDYTTAPLRFSDHRPVYATFQCTISIVDEPKKEHLSQQIYSQRKADIGGVTANSQNEIVDDEDLVDYDPIAPGLPPASSDRRKWWLDNGSLARSSLQPPGDEAMLNDRRPKNPFSKTHEADWIMRAGMQPSSQTPNVQPIPTQGKTTTPNEIRRLPPPYDGERSLAVTDLGSQMRHSSASEYVRPQPLNNPSSASPASAVARKPAPPIPKKPDLSVCHNEPQSIHDMSHIKKMPLTPRTTVHELSESSSPSLQVARHISNLGHSSQRLRETSSRSVSDEGPPLPPRKISAGSDTIKGLMDEENKGAEAIPTLQPKTR